MKNADVSKRKNMYRGTKETSLKHLNINNNNYLKNDGHFEFEVFHKLGGD